MIGADFTLAFLIRKTLTENKLGFKKYVINNFLVQKYKYARKWQVTRNQHRSENWKQQQITLVTVLFKTPQVVRYMYKVSTRIQVIFGKQCSPCSQNALRFHASQSVMLLSGSPRKNMNPNSVNFLFNLYTVQNLYRIWVLIHWIALKIHTKILIPKWNGSLLCWASTANSAQISLEIHILDLRVLPTSQNYAHFTSVKVLPKTSLCLLHSGGNAVQPNVWSPSHCSGISVPKVHVKSMWILTAFSLPFDAIQCTWWVTD